MRKIETQIEINCSAKKVWNALVDFKSYAKWNPFIMDIEGPLKEGSHLKVTICSPKGKKMSFSPQLIKVDKEQKFSWQGKFVIKGLFDGAHMFEIVPLEKNKVLFIQVEYFSGLLVPLLWKIIQPRTRSGFEAMNKALKKYLE